MLLGVVMFLLSVFCLSLVHVGSYVCFIFCLFVGACVFVNVCVSGDLFKSV